MAGNEIAQLAASLKFDTGDFDKKFSKFKTELSGADAKLTQLKSAVDSSANSVRKASIAYQQYALEVKKSADVTPEMKAKLEGLKNSLAQETLALNINKKALLEYQATTAAAAAETTVLTDVMNSLGLTATGIIAGITGIVSALALITGGASLKAASDFEQLSIAFEVLTGSSSKGQALVDQLIQLANVTPMTTQGLAENARMLLAMGEAYQNIIPDLKMLGDVSGGNQEKLNSLALVFGQVGARGRLTGDNLRQMQEQGFDPLNVIAKKTGETMSEVQDRMEKGRIPFSEFKQTLVEVTSEGGRFYGMMNKQSKTLSGELSTMSDAFQAVGRNIGAAFIPAAKSVVEFLTKIAQKAEMATRSLKIMGASVDTLNQKELNSRLIKLREEKSIKSNVPYTNPAIQKRLKEINDEEYIVKKRIESLKKQDIEAQKREASAAKSGIGSGFKDSAKEAKSKTRKGAADKQMRDDIAILKEKADMEIALNNLTGEQALETKIKYEKQIIAVTKAGTKERYQAEADLAQLERQLSEAKLNTYKLDNEVKKAQIRLNTKDTTQAQRQSAIEIAKIDLETQTKILAQQKLGTDGYKQALIDKLNAERTFNEAVNAEKKEMTQKTNDIVKNGMRDTIQGFVMGTQSIKDIWKNMLLEMAASWAEQKFANWFEGIGGVSGLFGLAGKGISKLGGLFGKGHATGGRPDPNKISLVGEKGAELFVPDGVRGEVIPNNKMASYLSGGETGQSGTVQPILVTNQISIQTLDGKQAYDVLMQNKPAIQKMIADGIHLNQAGLRDQVKKV